MISNIFKFVLGGTALALAACSTTPYLDSQFGHAVNAAKAAQTLNPEGSLNTDPVAGIDGRAAKESIERYQDSFKEPPRTFDVIFGTTTGGGGR